MSKIRKNKGFTLAEVLIVVALIGVLSGVAFIAVWSHLRSMAQLERDTIAKEIYVAAQNHLTAAKSQGYLNLKIAEYGIPGTSDEDQDPEDTKKIVSYYLVAPNVGSTYQKIYDLMLPFGAVDETVLAGGSYIIRYQPTSASVLDVFYCVQSGRFAHTFTDTEYKALVDGMRDVDKDGNSVDKKSARRNYGTNNAVIGWYGGENAVTVGERLNVPSIEIINAERLQVKVTDNNSGISYASLKLIVEGVTSGAKKAFPLIEGGERVVEMNGSTYTVTLDEITNSKSGFHFCDLAADTADKPFSPGENIKVYAVSYSNSTLTNVAKSTESITNSLFGYDPKADQDIAQISNIRHLENLDYRVSHVAVEAGKTKEAVQTTDLIWKKKDSTESGLKNPDGFVDIINPGASDVVIYSPRNGSDSVIVSLTQPGCFFPVCAGNTESQHFLDYDGNNHSISGVTVNYAGDAGIFGALNGGSVSNLLVLDSDISSTSTSSPGAAGGLIGSMTGTTVERCAANGTVKSGDAAGGLIGLATGGTVTACYSAGHTKDGSYQDWVDADGHTYDVTGTTAGGLIGISTADISDSYSTCSVSGTTTGGGLIGDGSGNVTNCYATGLVDAKGTTIGAFAGSYNGKAEGCLYYEIINPTYDSTTTGTGDNVVTSKTITGYLKAVGDGEYDDIITALDANAGTYDSFVDAESTWVNAVPKDETLQDYYNGRFTLRTVDQIEQETKMVPDAATQGDAESIVATHYGDWPAPEVFIINN